MNREMTVGPYRLTLFLPDGPYSGAIYIPSHGRPEEVARLISPLRAALVFIDGFDWNRDLSPWPAEPVFGTEAFGGQADAFLETLTRELIPAAEREMPGDICWRGIAGYSLAGLFAVYAAYRSSLFSRVASASGSVWFDGWTEYAESHPFTGNVTHAFFSVGAKEKKTRNPRMQPVEECTRQMHELFERRGVNSRFALNPGNHFADAEKRLAAAIAHLSEE